MPANSVPDYMYPSADSHAHPPRQPQQQPQQPLGISWDHPIFAQQNPGQGHAVHQDQNHGIYTPAPQSWQSNPFAQPPGFGLPPQYQQVHHYPQGQVPFDSQSMNPSDNSSLSPYPLSQNYYPSQQLPVQNPQLSQYQNTPQPPLPQFSVRMLHATSNIKLTRADSDSASCWLSGTQFEYPGPPDNKSSVSEHAAICHAAEYTAP